MEAVFHLTGTYWKRGNEVFIWFFLSIVSFRVFLYKWKLLLKLSGSQFFKDKSYSTTGHQFFQFFQRLLKVDAAFPYIGNVFINILHAVRGNGFSA